VGEARMFDRHSDGVDVDLDDQPDAPPARTRLLVNADVGVGSLRIGHSAGDIAFDHANFDYGTIDDDLGSNTGCAA
jgi:hypothetical protein